jgi:hypothetical protein
MSPSSGLKTEAVSSLEISVKNFKTACQEIKKFAIYTTYLILHNLSCWMLTE